MSDLISRNEVLDEFNAMCEVCGKREKYNGVMCRCCALDDAIAFVEDIPSTEPERKGMMTTHEVACLLAELFDDPCACNYNGIDEWLPEKCELQNSCPNPVGVACWEQFLKYRGDVPLGNSEKN